MTEDNLWYLLCGVLIGLIVGLQVPAIDRLPWWPYCAGALIAWVVLSAVVRWYWRLTRRKHGNNKSKV